MKKLLIYLRDYTKECILGPVFKLLESLFDLTVPMVTAAIIDYGIAQNDKQKIIGFGGLLLLLAIVGLTCAVTAQYFAAKAAVGFAAKLREALFSHMEGLSFTELDQIGTSTLMTRMTSDINQMQTGVNMFLRLFLRSPFIVFGAMIMAFTIDVRAALIFVVAIPLLALVVFGIMAISMPLYKKVQGILDIVLGSTRENLSGVRVIRAFHREDKEVEEYYEKTDILSKAQMFVGRISALTNPVTYVIINISLVALLWTSGIRINAGSLSQGQVIALVNYLSQILVELIKLANTIVLTNKSIACGARISAILEMKPTLCSPENVENANGVKGEVEFSNVSICYANAKENSVEGVDFVAKSGETIGIIGGTGSGKSSLVNLIPRFYDATEGTISVDGIDVKRQDINELRRKIGIVLQKAILFQGTIRDNLLWGNDNATEEDLIEALKISQSLDFVMEKEKGLDSAVAQGGRNFSGGQRQRLTIARALVRKPEILIFDDSTSALDYATDAKLRAAIGKLSYKPTVFLVSQRTSSLLHADKIVVLDDGKVVGIGTHDELLASCEVYREIHESQFTSHKK